MPKKLSKTTDKSKPVEKKKLVASDYHPEGHKLVYLPSGRIIIFKKATMKHQKQATVNSDVQGVGFNGLSFAVEFLKVLFLQIHRANGDKIDVEGLDLMNEVLTLSECNDLVLIIEKISGINTEKKNPIKIV